MLVGLEGTSCSGPAVLAAVAVMLAMCVSGWVPGRRLSRALPWQMDTRGS